MTTWFITTILVSFVTAVILSRLMILLAQRWRVLDDPGAAPDRKQHTAPTPLLGGVAVILASWVAWLVLLAANVFPSEVLPLKHLVGLGIASLILLVIGVIDDKWRLSVGWQLTGTIVAALVIVGTGIGIHYITNPLGGIIWLNQQSISIFTWQGVPYHLVLWADVFTFVWLLGATYTTKILDGLDGLVGGLGVIGAIVVFLLTLRPEVSQPAIGLLALGLAGATAGFLVWNWHPAKIFLGESGSLYIGFILGTLSIISGGKIATALLILGLPILDLLWVIIQRVRRRRSPLATADRLHLHFRLLDAGLSVRQSVLLLYGVIIVFGFSTLFVHGVWKLIALSLLLIVMIGLVWWVMRRIAQRRLNGDIH
ncbi:MAG: undecaprenyl/decaprenyl-phosphate alpha-N-acetylglucosaminyl 1-phosphate transferase [Candidatus Kerfeldbacteria bacterium]|nr:undecaprenyl/decaprenyl-phosphate alpha-N-acetylglucosaminyl 1-phosphate transferase [Candidatus Kerfeldbacteria bacterium]